MIGRSCGARSRARASIGSETSRPRTAPSRTDALGEVDRRRSAAAADVDHALAGLRLRRCDQPVGNRAEHLILMFLVVGPSLSGGGVPILGLSGVVGVDWRSGHGASFFGASCGGAQLIPFSRGRNVSATMSWLQKMSLNCHEMRTTWRRRPPRQVGSRRGDASMASEPPSERMRASRVTFPVAQPVMIGPKMIGSGSALT